MQFTFTDSEERTYPNIVVNDAVLVAEPGQTYDLDADPSDGRWTAAEATQSAPEAPVAPATPEADPTSTPTN